MITPTKIEKLDKRFPGLADQVRRWFDLGIHVRDVAELLREHYGVSVPKSTVGNFRARRWARERETRESLIAKRQAVEEVIRELEMKDRPETPTAFLQAKVRLVFDPESSGRFKDVLAYVHSEHRLPKSVK
jgi:hypothetical protein